MNTEQRIRSLVPELQELSFGCEVKSHNSSRKRFYLGRDDEELNLHWFEEGQVEYNDDTFYSEGIREEFSKDEILGHKIELHHVLQAIDVMANSWNVYVHANGVITHEVWGYDLLDKPVQLSSTDMKWDLTKNWDGQSKETQDFIGELLK